MDIAKPVRTNGRSSKNVAFRVILFSEELCRSEVSFLIIRRNIGRVLATSFIERQMLPDSSLKNRSFMQLGLFAEVINQIRQASNVASNSLRMIIHGWRRL